jgi:hypothetical protein
LKRSRFGIVVISESFLRKEWPQKELDGLVAREVDGVKVLLPVWHGVTADDVRACSLLLADRMAVSSHTGIENVVAEVMRAIQPDNKSRKSPAQKLGANRERGAQVGLGSGRPRSARPVPPIPKIR